MSKDKARLQATLGNLLGFDDGSEDVLEHLLSIESKDDLSEYLSQLLGTGRDELQEFVDNVCRYQKGEPLVLSNVANGTDASTGNLDSSSSTKESSTKTSAPAVAKQQQSSKTMNVGGSRRNPNQQPKSKIPGSTKNVGKSTGPHNKKKVDPAPSSSSSLSQSQINNNSRTKQVVVEVTQQQEEQIVKSHPTRGRATIFCGCYGTKHEALTNCLYCGRISCAVEGYGFCPFCGMMVDEITDNVLRHKDNKAWLQKERLLRFDREFARRTVILDDQADYQAPSNWMTEEEKVGAEENQQKQINSLRRKKQTMNLAF